MTWDIFTDSLPELLVAAGGTLRMTAFAFLFAALSSAWRSPFCASPAALTGRLAFLYIEVVRGMPALALLFRIYFGLVALGLVLNSFVAAVVAFGLERRCLFSGGLSRGHTGGRDPGQRESGPNARPPTLSGDVPDHPASGRAPSCCRRWATIWCRC